MTILLLNSCECQLKDQVSVCYIISFFIKIIQYYAEIIICYYATMQWI